MSNNVYTRDLALPECERALSMAETMYLAFSRQPIPASTYFHVTTLKTNAPIQEADVIRALGKLTSVHFLLRCRLRFDAKTGDAWYTEMEEMDMPVEERKYEEWWKVVSEELTKKFDFERGPLWRVVWMEKGQTNDAFEYVLVFICFHGMCDGKGGHDLIVNQLIPILVSGGSVSPALNCGPFEHVYDANYKTLSQYSSPWYVRGLCRVADYFYNGSAKQRRHQEIDAGRQQNQTRNYGFEVDTITTQKFVALCKLHKCSVHAALSIVVASQARKLAVESRMPADVFKTVNFPIDARRFVEQLTTSPMPMGSYTINGRCTPDLTASFFDEAQRLTPIVRDQVKLHDLVLTVMLNFIAHRVREVKIEMMMRYFLAHPMLMLSNVGDGGRSDVVGSEFFGAVGNDSFFLSLTTFNEKLCFCACFDNGWFELDCVKRFADNLKSHVADIVQN